MGPTNKAPRGNTKATQWLLVLNSKIKEPQEALIKQLEAFQTCLLNYNRFKYVFTIIHDKDQEKTTHAHAYLTLYEPSTLKELLIELADLLNCEKEQISLEPTNSDYLGVQYLTHKNQPEKEQYNLDQVRTNNQEELSRRIAEKYKSEQDIIIEALNTSNTMNDLLKKISLADAKKYQSIWTILLKERKADVEGLGEAYKYILNEYNSLYDFTSKLIDALENGLTEREKRIINLKKFIQIFNEFDIKY
jgi:hypothetical protein